LFQEEKMSWVYLVLAGVVEIGWPFGLKLAQGSEHRSKGIVLAIVAMGLSGGLLWLAQRQISLGTAYAVWTGIGAAGTFLLGVMLFGDPATLGRYLGVTLIIGGVVVLKLAH
jgi:quaternary ammonium compound-resistance protein SugE